MTSRKQKEKKKKIQQRQTAQKTGNLEAMQVNSLQQRLSKLDALRRSEHLELVGLRSANQLLARDVSELERKLKGQEKLTADMHNNHVAMRQSLADIRELHCAVPINVSSFNKETQKLDQHYECKECRRRWPCTTYSLITMPEQVAITGLLLIEQDLRKEGS